MAWTTTLVALAITGAGVVTGLLFAFSNCTLQALADLPEEHGMFAMQRVNERILNPVFLVFFFGTPLLCLVVALQTLVNSGAQGNGLLLVGALFYLTGPFGITVTKNVPLNNRLAEADSTVAEQAWPEYRSKWQFWNHVRTYMGVASIFLLALGLAAHQGGQAL